MLQFVFCLLAVFVFGTASAAPPASGTLPPQSPTTGSIDNKSSTWQYRVTGRHDQDRALFTQGFVFDGDTLWISSGLYQQSHVVALDRDNRIISTIVLPKNIFGEGLAIANKLLWVLSWREHHVLRYDLATLKPRKPLPYTGEGWGLTFDGTHLIRSDGTSTLHFHRSTDFKVTRTLKVTDSGAPVHNLNELEWIDGLIYANVWLTNMIFVVDPASGHVIGHLDLTGLLPAKDFRSDTDVLNGIAWNARKKELWVTGKRWPARFALTIDKSK